MNNRVYAEDELVRQLNGLPVIFRVAFATACAERLLPMYLHYTEQSHRGDSNIMAGAVCFLWETLLGRETSKDELQNHIDSRMTLIPGDDDVPWVKGQAYAENSASAVVFALRTLHSGESQEAAWAAQNAYEASDYYVTHELNFEYGSAEAEQRIRSHPVVQIELQRQQRDLQDLLSAAGTDNTSSVITMLRDRARADAQAFFEVDA